MCVCERVGGWGGAWVGTTCGWVATPGEPAEAINCGENRGENCGEELGPAPLDTLLPDRRRIDRVACLSAGARAAAGAAAGAAAAGGEGGGERGAGRLGGPAPTKAFVASAAASMPHWTLCDRLRERFSAALTAVAAPSCRKLTSLSSSSGGAIWLGLGVGAWS